MNTSKLIFSLFFVLKNDPIISIDKYFCDLNPFFSLIGVQLSF
jgi:hypothetical protein